MHRNTVNSLNDKLNLILSIRGYGIRKISYVNKKKNPATAPTVTGVLPRFVAYALRFRFGFRSLSFARPRGLGGKAQLDSIKAVSSLPLLDGELVPFSSAAFYRLLSFLFV